MTTDSPGGDRPRWLGWAAVVVAGGAVVVVLFWPVADWLAQHDVPKMRGVSAQQRAEQLRQARDAARGRILQLGVGLLAAGALIYTGRNFTLARRQNELNRQTLELSREQAREQAEANRRTLELGEQGQVTDRYSKAIEQVGSDTLTIRLGGIYALERIARESSRDHPAVMEVLSAFVREHAHEPWKAFPGPWETFPVLSYRDEEPEQGEDRPLSRHLRPDVQAALAVIGRREHQGAVDLTEADFSHAHLVNVVLSNTGLWRMSLVRANLNEADLAGADLQEANLTDAWLLNADLSNANLMEADLTRAKLHSARLAGAFLGGAKLTKASLIQADFTHAHLLGCDLTGADLYDARLGHADLDGSDFARANLTEADLAQASLREAKLRSAKLTAADLTGADLTDADLSDADLTDAKLAGAKLTKARLTGADLTGANLANAVVDRFDRLPAGWIREPGSNRLRYDHGEQPGDGTRAQ